MADAILTGAFSAIPAAGTDGRLYLPSDGSCVYRDDGVAWNPWGPIFPFTAPVNDDFAWVNQGGASVDADHGGIFLLAPANAGASLRVRKKSAPSTPYTIDIGFVMQAERDNSRDAGFVWRQSSDGKLVTVALGVTTATMLSISLLKWTDATTYSALYAVTSWEKWTPICWLRCADTGANRVVSVSCDRRHWEQIHSVGRTDFLTADEVGFFANESNNTYQCGMELLHWEEA